MNKVNDLFKEGIKVIPFIVLGDPDLISNEHLLKALDEKAYDLLMLGLPFSDPVMETSLIQKANTRAIAKGISSDKAFDFLSRLKLKAKLILRAYANVIFSYGIEAFAQRAQAVGVKAILIPDVPLEERDEFAQVFEEYDIMMIFVAVPTSAERLKAICQKKEGLIYLENDYESGDPFEEIKDLSMDIKDFNEGLIRLCDFDPLKTIDDYADIVEGLIVSDELIALNEQAKIADIMAYLEKIKNPQK